MQAIFSYQTFSYVSIFLGKRKNVFPFSFQADKNDCERACIFRMPACGLLVAACLTVVKLRGNG